MGDDEKEWNCVAQMIVDGTVVDRYDERNRESSSQIVGGLAKVL